MGVNVGGEKTAVHDDFLAPPVPPKQHIVRWKLCPPMPNRVDASQRHVHGVQKVTQQPREKEKAHDHEVGALILDRARDGENGEKNCRVEVQRNDLDAVREDSVIGSQISTNEPQRGIIFLFDL